jgi:penicillin amidase
MDFYKRYPILCLFTAFVLLPLCVVLTLVFQYIQSTVSLAPAKLAVQGIGAPVSIGLDEHGVAYIQAKTDPDAFFAVGYMHARDRLWQLEVQKRMSRGTLAEVFGSSALGFDIYVRTLGLNRSAIDSWASLSPQAQQSLDAYSQGINSWIAQNHPLPPEFSLLGITPDQWLPSDSLAWVKMFALSLSGNFQQDLNRYVISQNLPDDKAGALLAGADKAHQLDTDKKRLQVAALHLLSSHSRLTEEEWGIGGPNVGSNAWVVASQLSDNQKATLVNDPHLGLEMPSQWYAMEVKGARLSAAGMSLVGLPLVLLGRNQSIGWGATNMMADTQDLYFEQVNTSDSSLYLRENQWLPFDSHIETINVKAEFPAFLREPIEPVKVRVRSTDKGPVISDLIGDLERPVSLSWVGGQGKDTSYQAFFDLNYATNWQEFNLAFKQHITPTLNMFYVDKEQNIGYLGVGKIPLRTSGNGSLPMPGWDNNFSWQGFIPDIDMPRVFNPPAGYLFSANNSPVEEDYPYFLSIDWADPERAERIEQILQQYIAEGDGISIEAHQAMLQDNLDLQAMKMLPYIAGLHSDKQHLTTMLSYLKEWNGKTSTDSVAATIYFTWLRHLRRGLFADEFSTFFGKSAVGLRQDEIVNNLRFRDIEQAFKSQKINWCDNLQTQLVETCDDIALQAFEDSHQELKKLLGSDMSDWQWGNIHYAKFVHRPFSQFRGLDSLFERTVSRGGSPNTINMSAFVFEPNKGFKQSVGPAFRQIIQFTDSSPNHLFINTLGQSGNIASQHYDDMLEPFMRGELLPFVAVEAAKVHTIELVPAYMKAEELK